MVMNPSSLGVPTWSRAPDGVVPRSYPDGLYRVTYAVPLTTNARVMAYPWLGAMPARGGEALATADSQRPAARSACMSANASPVQVGAVNVWAGLPVTASTTAPGLVSRPDGSRLS